MQFEAVIGLEVHAQLATESKIFCACPAKPPLGKSVAEVEPNAHTCPICAGHPGTLPVLNRRAVEFAMIAGLATHCRINAQNVFARKSYFYPDLPKGYQTSQFDKPLCEGGYLDIETAQGAKRVKIQRIHMEEDAGKNVHCPDYSLVNLNRAGIPLMEIVTEPDLRSAAEAGAYLRGLHAIVTSLGVCDGNMQEGNFRCDANVSIRPVGSEKFGTRAEIKNVNSFRYVEKAIEHEIARQEARVRAGQPIIQETRGYDADRDATYSMRSKEDAHDYRYTPDPDLIVVQVSAEWIEKIRATLPELPEQKRARYVSEFGLSEYDAGVLTTSPSLARFFERVLAAGVAKQMAKPAANLLTGEISRRLNEVNIDIEQSKVKPTHLSDTVALVLQSLISATAAKKILQVVWDTGDAVEVIVAREGLRQVSDLSALDPVIDQVLAANPSQVAEFKAGKEKIIGFLVGQVMKATGGKANPGLLQELIRKKLSNSSAE